jgi:transaldolase
MELYIDTANIDEIRRAAALGVLDGVTTNPSLVAKEGVDFHTRLKEICQVVKGPVSAEVVSLEHDGMVAEAEVLTALADNICIKLPCIEEGLKACKTLSDRGVKVNMTLCFQPMQALLAAKAGAFLISPFLGRIDDISGDGIRHATHMVQAAMLGADVATVPFKVIQQLLKHPLTDIGLEKFLADWEKTKAAVMA